MSHVKFRLKSINLITVLCLACFCSSVNAQGESVSTSSIQGSPQDNTVTTTTIQPAQNGTVTKMVETRHTIITTVPTANAVIPVPTGYVSCEVSVAGWVGNVWVPSHKICKYEASAEGVAWVDGYWQCNSASVDGVCTIWEWKAGHWEKTYPAE